MFSLLLLAFFPLLTSALYVTSPDGTKIWAESTGDPSKPAVVFIPGFSCSSLAFKKQWEDCFMKDNLFMVRYDVRGQGISDQPMNESAYGSQQHAQDFKAVVDHFGIGEKKPILAGWSMGGVTAADVATYYPNILGGVILYGSFPHRNMHSVVATPWVLDFIPRLLDKSLSGFGPTIKEFAESCVAHGDQLDQGTKYQWMGAVAFQHPDIRIWSIPHTQNETALMRFAAKSLPYLVLHGSMDKHVDGTKLKAWMEPRFGNLRFKLYTNFPDTGHASFWDNPNETNCEVVAFAQRLNSNPAVLGDPGDDKIPCLQLHRNH